MKLKSTFRKATAGALSVLMAASAVVTSAGAATDNTASVSLVAGASEKYEALAAEYDKLAYSGDDLGAIYSPESTTFKVWSPSASAVQLNLYTTGSDDEEGAAKISTQDMSYDETNGVWSVTANGDLKNVYYTYSVTNDGETEEVVDVYAKAVGIEGNRGMVVDLASTDPDGWDSDNTFTRVSNQTDANVWEIHVKDFSYDESSGVSEANRGKYLAFTEDNTTLNNNGVNKTGTSYLKDVGFNYVQINPFYDFGSVVEANSENAFNWGYDPKNYNVPEGSYSSNPYDGNVRINEAKQMIQGLHKQGIGVIMDVVYNHTQSSDSWFQKTVPNYYYRFNTSDDFANASGCGNETASNHEMYRKYMIDSVTYWAKEYHIDGFRFDLMGIHDIDTMNAIREALDEIDPNIIMYGEGWNMGALLDNTTGNGAATQMNSSKLSTRIGFFNDQIRDSIKGSVFEKTGKGFIQGDATKAAGIITGLTANVNGGNWTSQAPEQTVTYDSCHDNNTLYDRLVYSMGYSDDGNFRYRYDDLVKLNKLAAAIVYGSQGTTFVLAGEEMARSKDGNENSYNASVDLNNIDWNNTVKFADVVSYYKGLLEFRNAYAPLRTPAAIDSVKASDLGDGVIANVYTTADAAYKTVAMLYNSSSEDATVTIPGTDLPSDWVILVNADRAGTISLGEVSGSTVTVPANGALYLVDKESYDASAPSKEIGTVEVQYITESTGEVVSSITMTGEVGTAYTTTEIDNFGLYYNLDRIEGNATGAFTADKQIVKYIYADNILQINDLDGDGEITIYDAVMVQKIVAGINVIDNPLIADVNKSGSVDIEDAVLYLRKVAQIKTPLGIGQVITHYVDEEGNSVAGDTTQTLKVGSAYKTAPAEVALYVLDETKLPENSEGLVGVSTVEVTYTYKYDGATATAHVKVPDGVKWKPNFYVWEELETTLQNCGAWPGTRMTAEEGHDGWYTITFARTGGPYNWIVNGSGQTTDMKGYTADELWIIMDSNTTCSSITETAPDNY